MTFWVSVLTITLAALISFFVVIGLYSYNKTFHNNPRKRPADPYRHIKDAGKDKEDTARRIIDEMIARPYENIYISAHDGLKLRARLYMQDENAPFAIGMHGYRSTPMLDFSGGGPLAMSCGLNLILPDQRACGESEGKAISFGYNESLDTLGWIRYVSERWGKDREIVLIGVSMGASTVIMTAGRGVPENVKGVIADCPYSSAKRIIERVMKKKHAPAFIVYPLLRAAAKILGGFDPNKAEIAEYASKTKIPLVIIHGEADDFVPHAMSEEICGATSYAQLNTFADASHVMSYLTDTERYERIIEEFLEKILENSKSPNR